MKVTVAVGLVCFALGWVLCKQWPSPPAGPSQDSTRAITLDSMLGRATARADSVSAVNAELSLQLTARGDSVRSEIRKEQADTGTPPADTSAKALGYWKARARSAEVLLDLAISADSVVQDGLRKALDNQIAETSRLTALVADVQDSLAQLSISIGMKDRELARANRACRIGTVNGGWSPLSGKADLSIGVSCEVFRLVKAVL